MCDYSDIEFVIPACNEAETIGRLVRELDKMYGGCSILVVDDGSVDNTGLIAREAGARVVRHNRSLGNGAAIKSGARNSIRPTLVFMDADGQHLAESAGPLLASKYDGYDLVVGSRAGREAHTSLARWFANSVYNFLSSKITGFPVTDLTSGLRVVDRDKFLSILHMLPNGFSYPTTSTMAFIRSAYQVKFVPVNIKPDTSGGSHISPIKDGSRFFLIIFKIGILYSPFKFLAPMAFLQLIVLFLLYMPGLIEGTPKFSNGMAMLAVGTVVTLGIATLAEQITTLMYR